MATRFMLGVGQSVQVRRAVLGERDAHGNQRRTYADPEILFVYAVAPTGASEQDALGRDWATTSTWDIYAPPGTELGAYDRVVLPGGIECEVLGEPRAWTQTGFADLLQVGGVHFIVQKKAG